MNIKELDLLEKQDVREKVISRTEVLDKVGDLLLLPSTEYATTNQVANYYEVTQRHIEDLIKSNKDELISDGFGIRKADDFITELNFGNKVTKQRGRFLVKMDEGDPVVFAPRGVNLFPKRAILRIGMLLRDSQIAKEIRTRLLDIIHDVEQSAPEIINNVTKEITQEQQIYLRLGLAVDEGNIDEILKANAELNQLKNKRITELENTNKQITTNALTIMESRAVINRIVRSIAMKEYSSMFGRAYGELYSKVNYKLGINIKARNKKKNESLLDTLSEEETLAVEKIVRSWAVEVGLDLNKLLKIA